MTRRLLHLLLPLGLLLAPASAAARTPSPFLQDGLDEELLRELREDVRRSLRHGQLELVREDLEGLLEEAPGDLLLLALRGRLKFEECDYEGALEDGRAALDEALGGGDELRPSSDGLARIARELADQLVELGDPGAALKTLESVGAALQPDSDARDAWTRGRALAAAGRREESRGVLRAGAQVGFQRWDQALAKARCQRALGDIRSAAETLVAADRLAVAENDGIAEPDVLVELGNLYFEAYGEVDEAVSRSHSPAELYREALKVSARHEGARLGLFELYRFNWMRHRESPRELLNEVFVHRPRSVEGLLAQVSWALDNGDLPTARRALKSLNAIAPARRDVRAERAALAWIEHRRADAQALLDELVASDPGDSEPELRIGEHLLELYRFAEGKPFLEKAVERDPSDWRAWTQLGRALANTADEVAAREALAKAVEVADGRRDAWRDNTALVLERMAESLIEHEASGLTFAWMPDAAPVLQRYLVPFYIEARDELAERYGHTPGPVKIEVFRKWDDFSVRSTGFQGFPALGVCFGPVVTAVSPLAEMRGSFSWARTSFHEFTHVVHLGLSHNRCPRWVTEGLATWEEGERNGSWWRNMRRELLDARANDEILPLRQLNQAFRTQRVLFAYYQSGLLCRMLIEKHGFPPMVRLLEAFDAGRDLDGAFEDVFATEVEEIDRQFLEFVDGELADLSIEPRWGAESTFRLRFSLSRRAPEDPASRGKWADDWCTVAWGSYWSGKRVDAEEALRLAESAGGLPARGEFLRGEIALSQRRAAEARAAFERGFQKGGEDYRARMALGELLLREDEADRALEQFRLAERDFPGFAEPLLSAELRQAAVHEGRGELEEAMAARERWLRFNAGDYDHRVLLASWLVSEDRHEEAERFWREANEVDPFRRMLHLSWGKTLSALGRHEEALSELEVALLVPPEVDPDRTGIEWEDLEPKILGLQALELIELGREAEARERVAAALELDAACAEALEAQETLGPDEVPDEGEGD